MALGALRQITAAGLATNMQTPLATETLAGFIDDIILHVKTTGTATNVTFTDPTITPAGSVATNPVVAVGATAEVFIAVNQLWTNTSTGLITAAFSGALTGVTAEWLRM
jgi:hypothetical protein